MVAKSEASMPMSRALAKLAVATELGTAARPSTAAPLSWPSGSSGSAGGGGKAGLATAGAAAGRSLALKPSAARNVLSSLPLPLSTFEQQQQQHKQQLQLQQQQNKQQMEQQGRMASATTASPQASSAAGGGGGRAASAGAAAAAAGHVAATPPSSTPRLPPLATHSPPPPSPRVTATAAAAAAGAVMAAQSRQHPQAAAAAVTSSPPLPPCGVPSSSPNIGISKELQETARKHPGLPASLLAQLNHSRQAGAPASAPLAAVHAPAPAAAPPPPPGTSGSGGSGGVRPLSPRSRARFTASLVNGGVAPPPPPPPAMAALSPEALAVLLGTSSQPPSAPPGGLLVMRRAAPAVVGAGAALRPSTAQQGGGGSGGGGSGSASPSASPGIASSSSRPTVVPHITVPYKPGSIRLPTGGVPGITAAVALKGPGSKGEPGPGTTAGSGTCMPAAPPASAAAVTAGAFASELLRPWTAAVGGSGALRPVTANPLTHSMPVETAALVVRVPRSAAEAQPGSAPPLPPSRAGSGSIAAGRSAPASARPGAAASGAGPAAHGGGSGGVGGDGGESQDARQLTAQELRAVVAALAAARPEAAAMLLQRPATAAATAAAASGGDAPGHPASNASRRPATNSSAAGTGAADAVVTGSSWDPGSLYGEAPQTGSSRASTRGSLLSGGALSVTARHPSAYDDKWPRPTSGGGSRPSSRGVTAAGPAAPPPLQAPAAADAPPRSTASCASRQPAISAWGSTIRPLQSIPEDEELPGGDGTSAGDGGAVAGGDVVAPLHPWLEPLEPDSELDVAWANIVAANQRPDTAAVRAPSAGLNVFSRPPTGAVRITRQAAPMVLVLEDLTASTPEVLERELESLSLEELQALRKKLAT